MKNNGMTAFHQRLRKLRQERGYTMREAARRIGVPETTYREWEYGRAIRGEPYVKIAKAFGVSLECLLGEAEPFTTEQRLDRIAEEVHIVRNQIKKSK